MQRSGRGKRARCLGSGRPLSLDMHWGLAVVGRQAVEQELVQKSEQLQGLRLALQVKSDFHVPFHMLRQCPWLQNRRARCAVARSCAWAAHERVQA
eukprot:6172692-Pleurochrysis_carterae.AAC.1